MFCNKTRSYLGLVNLRGIFERLLKKAGLPHMRFHDLRHTAITLMLKAGVLPLFDPSAILPRGLPSDFSPLDQTRRQRSLVRIGSGGGSLEDVNWLLLRGYQVHGNDYAGRHARSLAQSVAVRFEAQQIVMRLRSLAHNRVIWARRWLAVPQLQHYG